VFHLACGPPRDSEESLGRALPTFPPSVSQIADTGPTNASEDTRLVGAPALSSRCAEATANSRDDSKSRPSKSRLTRAHPFGRCNLRNQPTRDAEEPLTDLFRSFQLPATQPCSSAMTYRVSKDPIRHHFQTLTKPELAPQRTALLWGFSPLRRLSTKAATYTGLTSPSCATPSGFLNLLTFYSAFAFLALFHARSVHGVGVLRVFPPPVAVAAFTARCPQPFTTLAAS
jgi:hypothetical protein